MLSLIREVGLEKKWRKQKWTKIIKLIIICKEYKIGTVVLFSKLKIRQIETYERRKKK